MTYLLLAFSLLLHPLVTIMFSLVPLADAIFLHGGSVIPWYRA